MVARDTVGGESVARRAVKSSVWVVVGFGFSVVLRLVSSVIMTRFIHPETYGLIDLVATLLLTLHLFSDIGILPCIVQSPRGDDPRALNTAWTLALVRNAIITAIAAAVAVPASIAYDKPILKWIMPVIGFCSVIEALASTGTFVLAREVRRGRLVVLELIYSLSTLCVTVASVYIWNPKGFMDVAAGRLAYLPFDESLTWTVVIGFVVGRTVTTLVSYLLTPGKWPRLDWERRTIHEIFGFGRWVLLSTGTTFISQQVDRFIAPKVANFEASGLYGRALGLVAMGTGVLEQLAGSVVFPIVSRINQDGKDTKRPLAEVGLLSKLLSGLILSGLFVAGPSLVHVLYPPTYSDVAWLLQCLVGVGWLQCQSSFAGAILMGIGKPAGPTVANVGKLIAVVAVAVPAAHLFTRAHLHPLFGIILGVSVGEIVRYGVYILLVVRRRLWSLREEAIGLAGTIAMTALSWYAGGALSHRVIGDTLVTKSAWILSLLLHGTMVVAIWGLLGALLWYLGLLRIPGLRRQPEPIVQQ